MKKTIRVISTEVPKGPVRLRSGQAAWRHVAKRRAPKGNLIKLNNHFLNGPICGVPSSRVLGWMAAHFGPQVHKVPFSRVRTWRTLSCKLRILRDVILRTQFLWMRISLHRTSVGLDLLVPILEAVP